MSILEDFWNNTFDVKVSKKVKKHKIDTKSKECNSKINESNKKRKSDVNYDSQDSSKENQNKRKKFDQKANVDYNDKRPLTESTENIKNRMKKPEAPKFSSLEDPKEILEKQQAKAKEILKKQKAETKIDGFKRSISIANKLPENVLVQAEIKQEMTPNVVSVSIPISKISSLEDLIKNQLPKVDDLKPSMINKKHSTPENKQEMSKVDISALNPLFKIASMKVLKNTQQENTQIKPQDDVKLPNTITKNISMEFLKKKQLETKVSGFKRPISATKCNELLPSAPVNISNEQYFKNLLNPSWHQEIFHGILENPVKSLADISVRVQSVLDWKFVALDSNDSLSRTFYMSRGECDVLMYNKEKKSWEELSDIKLEMPAETIVYGELVTEYSGEEKCQTSSIAFHIIDAIILGGKDISKLPLSERNKLCNNFTKSCTESESPNKDKRVTFRTKELFDFTSLNIFFYYLTQRKMENNLRKFGININPDQPCSEFFIPCGIMMMNDVRSDVARCYSKKHDMLYFFEKLTKVSRFEKDVTSFEDVYASFKNTFMNRFVWKIQNQEQFAEEIPNNKNREIMYRDDMINFISHRLESLS